MIDYKLLKDMWQTYRDNRDHTFLAEAPIVWDRDTLFTIAGMQQLVPYLEWEKHPQWTKLYNIQKCIRTVDIEEVGDDTHLTLFEMMWNRSLWDYGKEQAISFAFNFLINNISLWRDSITVSIYKWDEEAYNAWKKYLPQNRIYEDIEENRWQLWENLPCWPCTEIFYDWIEIRNLVFMEYKNTDKWLEELAQKNIDTGMWFERILAILEWKNNIYETSIFDWIRDKIDKPEKEKRIIMDHWRTFCVLSAEWLEPINNWPWYTMKKLIRRASYYMHDDEISDIMLDLSTWTYELYWLQADVFTLINEAKKFKKVLREWEKKFRKLKNPTIKDIFMLYDTYWLPIEFIDIIVGEYDKNHLYEMIEAHKKKSRQAGKQRFHWKENG